MEQDTLGTYNPGLDSAGAQTGQGPAEDKGDGVGRGAAKGRAHLEEQDGRQKHRLDRKVLVDLAKDELEGAVCQHVGGAVPANVAGRVEVVCNLRYGRRDDQPVQGHEKEGHVDGEHEQGELHAGGVVGRFREWIRRCIWSWVRCRVLGSRFGRL